MPKDKQGVGALDEVLGALGSTLSGVLQARLIKLLDDEAWVEAGRLLELEGAFADAAQLYAFAHLPRDEARAARACGSLLQAHSALLHAGERKQAAALRLEILGQKGRQDDGQVLETLWAALAETGQLLEAAALAEKAGALEEAASFRERSGDLFGASSCLRLLGELPRATRLLEQLVQEQTIVGEGSNRWEARVALARLYLAGAKSGEAILLMQSMLGQPAALQQPAPVDEAHYGLLKQALVLEIAGLVQENLPAATEEALDRLASLDPLAPRNAEALVRAASLQVETSEDPAERGPQWVLGRYRLEKRLGAGSAGQVYLAFDAKRQEQVALKLLAPSTVATAGAQARFYRELQVARSIESPAVVRVLDTYPERGLLVMEYLGGGTLAQRLRGGRRLPPGEVARLGREIAQALAAAHRRGVLHRDVKPANILFDRAGAAKLCDFGAAHLFAFEQTGTGTMLGTLAYQSPEQLRFETLSARADLFALAVTLYRSLTGYLPFPGPELLQQQRAGARAPSLRLAGAGIGFGAEAARRLDAFFEQVLSFETGKRPSSGEAFAELLWTTAEMGPLEAAPAVKSLSALEPRPVQEIRGPEGQEVSTTLGSGQAGGPPCLAGLRRFEWELALGRRVHLAYDQSLGRRVVLDCMSTPLTDRNLEALRAHAAESNPHLQTLLGLIADQGVAVYQLVEGQTLEELWSQSLLTWEGAIRLAADIARGYAARLGAFSLDRVRVLHGRGVLLVAGSEEPSEGGRTLEDLRPSLATLLRRCGFGGGLEGEAPLHPAALARWLDGWRRPGQ